MSLWEKISHADASTSRGMWVVILLVDAGLLVLGLLMSFLMQNGMPMAIAGLGIGAFTLLGALRSTVIEGSGNALIAKGGSTPSVNQHSNIESLEARGRFREAADGYRAAMTADPKDIVACEKLAQLAIRELKEYETAIFAYREADKRSTEPRRQLGYALLVAGIYRDNLKDEGKAMVELRKVLARFPDAPNADRLRQELSEMKAHHFEGS